jgi:transcription-repair coupling factor (superfamily II helicase)
MLKRAIESLQGKAPSWTIDTRVDTPFDAKLPEYYVNEVSLRMEFYQRLGEARTQEEVAAISEELRDRFGALPEPALWLLSLSRVRTYAASHGFTTIKLDSYTLFLERKTGKESHTNKVLVGRIKTPEDFETKVRAAIDGMLSK